MIKRDEITKIGRLVKPHGIKGDITATLDYDIDLMQLKCIVVNVDGIFVPFFVDEVRPKSSETVIATLEDVKDDAMARRLCGNDYYALNSDLDFDESPDEEGGYVSDFVGSNIITPDGNTIGKITDFDDSTANILFIVEASDGDTIYIPVAEEFIKSISPENKTIVMELPEGLLE